MTKTMNGFKVTIKADGTISIGHKKWGTSQFDGIPSAGEYLYNMADNNDIGNDMCRKLSKWSGINMCGERCSNVY